MLKSRRKAREAALRALYEMEVGKVRLADALQDLRANSEMPSDLMEFAEELLNGVHDRMALIDDKLSARIRDWDFDRIAPIDRNLMRIAAFELFYCEDIPPAVSINEAVEIAKKYSTAESGKFVNGVLGALLYDSPKANWDASRFAERQEEAAPAEAEPEEERITPDDPQAKELSRIGLWKIREE